MSAPRSLKGTWPQAFVSFFLPILAILAIRWAVLEPYVIPSGSMIPNLLVHDHIFVKKFSFGVRLPFSDYWLLRWSEPRAGDVIVFRYPQNPALFYVKRLIAGPGSVVQVRDGRITVDEKEWTLTQTEWRDLDGFHYFSEDAGTGAHTVRFASMAPADADSQEWTVPAGHYFFMGDNRDQSSDSRAWGFVSERDLIGKAWFIWLSCDEMLESAKFICDPSTLRWNRIGQSVTQP